MDRYPGRIWVVAHKPVAVASGLGVMGVHRNVIHPKFGNFIVLGTVIVATPITSYVEPLDYSPCLECKLCLAVCPAGEDVAQACQGRRQRYSAAASAATEYPGEGLRLPQT